ncbi:MAG: dehydrogenase [Leptolyngbya sp. PLA1]|nr:dehydrogenase [Leptolyngbya sp. PLA1]
MSAGERAARTLGIMKDGQRLQSSSRERSGRAWAVLCAGVTLAAVLAVRASTGVAQRYAGTSPGPAAPPRPLSPDESLARFSIARGFRIEVAAAEPLVEAPVALNFDEHGRAWVVEMRGYMPDVEGSNELEPNGRIVVLTDLDHDGDFDDRRVFMDGLVLPRAVLPCFGGALVIAPPDLIFAKDTDGDGVAETRKVLATGLGGLDNPEHAPNSLTWGLDNWVHLSQHNMEYRFDGERVTTRRTPGHGQWGLTQDDSGRLYYSPNPEALRGDLFPKHYASRNPAQRDAAGINRLVSPDQTVWPAMPTPAVNRGYLEGVLRPDGRLAAHTAACGPTIYREPLLPGCGGDVFVCEPAAYMVRRLHLKETAAGPVATNAYEGGEFLTSTDVRFRPVWTCAGPEGALYIVDMHRGVIQHRQFITPYLKEQTARLGIQGPLNMGRIYRVVPEHGAPGPAGLPADVATEQLVAMLDAPGAWWRLTAQRLLVERRDPAATPALDALLSSGSPRAALHALWTLDGTGALTAAHVLRAMQSGDTALQNAGVRVGERFPGDDRVRHAMIALGSLPGTRVQVLLSLGEDAGEDVPRAIARLATTPECGAVERAAAVSSLAGREAAALDAVLAMPWDSAAPRALAADLADCLLRVDRPEPRTALLERVAAAAQDAPSKAGVLLGRVAAHQGIGKDKPRTITLKAEPKGWSAVLAAGPLAEDARASDALLAWPGKSVAQASSELRPLSKDEQARFDSGRGLFATCSGCHGLDGNGTPGQIPPLAGSARVQGRPSRVIPVLLHGLMPTQAPGQPPPTLMPPVPFDDEESIAAVLTYVRRAWGNRGEPVTPEEVARIRELTDDRTKPWTVEELDALP